MGFVDSYYIVCRAMGSMMARCAGCGQFYSTHNNADIITSGKRVFHIGCWNDHCEKAQ